MIDMEHPPISVEIMTQMVHAVVSSSQGTCLPLVRVPSHGVEWIKWALDIGASGITVPMVNKAQDVRGILDKPLCPPNGRRSFGSLMAAFAHPMGPKTGMAGYIERVGRGDIIILPMMESREGVENTEEILNMDGVAGVFVGRAELRMSLGLPVGLDGNEVEFVDALRRICKVVKKYGKITGTMGIGEVVKKRVADSFDFLLSTSDYGSIATGFQKDLAEVRKASNGPSQL